MDEHRKDETRRKLPPLPSRRQGRERPWTREDFMRDLRRVTRRTPDKTT